MARIVHERQAGRSWHCIASQLLRDGVRTPAENEWSVARVRRAYAAALRIQEEARQSAGREAITT
jgi:hypothetical protein